MRKTVAVCVGLGGQIGFWLNSGLAGRDGFVPGKVLLSPISAGAVPQILIGMRVRISVVFFSVCVKRTSFSMKETELTLKSLVWNMS